MSGHIQDIWYSPGPRGGRPRPTAKHGTGKRWKARYLDPDGRERGKSFTRKKAAEDFLTEIEHSKNRGTYLDPDAGRITVAGRMPYWLSTLTCDPTTVALITARVSRHIIPVLGGKRLDQLARSPSQVTAWLAGLPVGNSYKNLIFGDLSAMLDQAVADSLIASNPCRNDNVKKSKPKVTLREIVPWTAEQVAGLRENMPGRYQAIADCGADLGLRQGEIFGLAVDDIDFLRRKVHVCRQVRLHLGKFPVFGPPKGGRKDGDKARDVPLPESASLMLAAHIERFPPRPVTLPWMTTAGRPRTVTLLFTTPRGGVINRPAFNRDTWQPARKAAGIPDGPDVGTHQLRHSYASRMLRGGIDVRRLAKYLGHHNATVTLRYYAHLLPNDEERSLREIEAALNPPAQKPQVDQNLKEQ
jgi:integrase